MSDPQIFTRSQLVARRSVVDIVDVGLAFCRSEYRTILTVVFAFFIPNVILKYFCFYLDLIPFERVFNSFSFHETASYTVPNVLLMIADGVVHTLMNGALCVFVYAHGTGKIRSSVFYMEEAIRRGLVLCRITFIAVGAIVLGFAACILPGAVLYLLFLFSTPVVMLEKRDGLGDVLKRCNDLMGGEWWRAIGFLALTWLLLFVLGLSLTFLASGVFNLILEQISWLSGLLPDFDLITMVGGLLVSLLLFPLEMVFTMLLYFEICSRKEGLDLVVLMERGDE